MAEQIAHTLPRVTCGRLANPQALARACLRMSPSSAAGLNSLRRSAWLVFLQPFNGFGVALVRMQMDRKKKPTSAVTMSERDLLIGAYIVAVGVVCFSIGYWGGRDIGSILFS